MLEFMLKNIHMRDMLKLWDEFLEQFKEVLLLDQDNNYFYVKRFLCYTSKKLPEEKQGELNDLFVKHLDNNSEELMGSLAQKYINEGISQGISQGIEMGENQRAKRIAINMLRSGLDVKMIASTTGLSLREIEKLKAENPTLPDAS